MTSPTQRAGADALLALAAEVDDGATQDYISEELRRIAKAEATNADWKHLYETEVNRQIAARVHAEEQRNAAIARAEQAERDYAALQARIAELEALINSPHNADWFEGVRIEAAHQVERWGSSHDIGKEPLDWLWLIGYLANKATAAALKGDTEKAKHHTISTGAALRNWHRAITGESTAMRPGIDSTRYDAAIDAHAQGQAGEEK